MTLPTIPILILLVEKHVAEVALSWRHHSVQIGPNSNTASIFKRESTTQGTTEYNMVQNNIATSIALYYILYTDVSLFLVEW